jgi:hypothetical protein
MATPLDAAALEVPAAVPAAATPRPPMPKTPPVAETPAEVAERAAAQKGAVAFHIAEVQRLLAAVPPPASPVARAPTDPAADRLETPAPSPTALRLAKELIPSPSTPSDAPDSRAAAELREAELLEVASVCAAIRSHGALASIRAIVWRRTIPSDRRRCRPTPLGGL